MAKIILEDMEFYAFHGCYAEERKIGAKFVVSVEMELNLEAAGRSDDLNDTINYETVFNLVKAEMHQPANLIEHVAYRIKNTILAEFHDIEHIQVKVSKIAPPLGGKIARTTVIY